MKTDRPKLIIPPTTTEQLVEILAMLGLIVAVIAAALYIPVMPDEVPIHFGLSGNADGFGPPWVLLTLPVLGIILYALLSVVARYPHVLNYPLQVTAESASRQYRLIRLFITIIKAEIVWLFVWLLFRAAAVTNGRVAGLGAYALLIALVVLFATCGLYVLRARRLA